MERNCCAPQWRCYAKYVNSQQILLTFLPASFSGAPYNASFFFTLRRAPAQSANINLAALFQCSDVLTLMASGLEAEPQSQVSTQEDTLSGSASGLERTSSSGHLPPRSPQALVVEQDGWERRVSQAETATSASGWFNADAQISPAENLV